jgi:hypothetical protein
VWTLSELVALLEAVAMLGGDQLTLAAIAVALGVVVKDGEANDAVQIRGGRGESSTSQPDARLTR